MGREEEGITLIVGLGNPGARYAETRHNIGFMVTQALAHLLGGSFSSDKKVKGQLARIRVDGKGVVLLMPGTYMNESGQSLRRCLDYLKLKPSQVLVICDDVDLPFGAMRLREKGGAGGHNGLKSIQCHLGTQDYPRLRLGIGDRSVGTLEGHVLGRFTAREMDELVPFLGRAVQVVEQLLAGDIREVMTSINQRKKKEQRVPDASKSSGGGPGENNGQARKKEPL